MAKKKVHVAEEDFIIFSPEGAAQEIKSIIPSINEATGKIVKSKEYRLKEPRLFSNGHHLLAIGMDNIKSFFKI